MEKYNKIFKAVYIAAAALTIYEYLFVTGMFTSPIALILIFVTGIINFVFSFKNKNYNEAVLYIVSTVGLSMGYWKIMFM